MSGPERTVGTQGLVFEEPLIFEQGSPGRVGFSMPPCDVPQKKAETLIPPHLLRGQIPGLPEVSEGEVVRHYTRISQWNFGIDLGFYPLGSCTMKYNPRVNEDVARLPGFAKVALPFLAWARRLSARRRSCRLWWFWGVRCAPGEWMAVPDDGSGGKIHS